MLEEGLGWAMKEINIGTQYVHELFSLLSDIPLGSVACHSYLLASEKRNGSKKYRNISMKHSKLEKRTPKTRGKIREPQRNLISAGTTKLRG